MCWEMVRRGRGGHRGPVWSAGRGGVSRGSGEMGPPEGSSRRISGRGRGVKRLNAALEFVVSREFVEVVGMVRDSTTDIVTR